VPAQHARALALFDFAVDRRLVVANLDGHVVLLHPGQVGLDHPGVVGLLEIDPRRPHATLPECRPAEDSPNRRSIR